MKEINAKLNNSTITAAAMRKTGPAAEQSPAQDLPRPLLLTSASSACSSSTSVSSSANVAELIDLIEMFPCEHPHFAKDANQLPPDFPSTLSGAVAYDHDINNIKPSSDTITTAVAQSSCPQICISSQSPQLQTTITAETDSTNCANYESAQDLAQRPIEELVKLVKSDKFDPKLLSNDEIIQLMLAHQVSVYKLESILGKSNAKRCVEIRRKYYLSELENLDKLDHQQQHDEFNKIDNCQTNNNNNMTQQHDKSSTTQASSCKQSRSDVLRQTQTSEFAYDKVVGACCENVIGCVRLPVGLVGPLKMDDENVFVPLATTEGCLVASTSRGLSALSKSGGVWSRVRKNCMTRAPIVRFQDPELKDALNNVDKAIEWLQEPANKEKIKKDFRSTSRHTVLIDYTLHPIGREIHIRFEAQTGDAMGMNMCSKGAELALKEMQRVFPTMDILTLSGNLCTDKKPSAINWTHGRGKSVECNALIPADVVEKVFKVPVDSLIECWLKKVMVGSAMAGSIGGFNCHAANIVAAIFIATGQDAAQVVSSSNCLLTLERDSRGALAVHCSMPSIECGTVGGGTVLSDQSSYLQLMGIRGPKQQSSDSAAGLEQPLAHRADGRLDSNDSDSNACKLARIICSTVMAAELSLLASLTEGTLVKSHMTHNRSAQPCKVV